MFGFCFNSSQQVTDYADVAKSDERLFKRFFHGMLEKGVYFAPSMYEAGFISSAHEPHDVNKTQLAAEQVFADCLHSE
jgi:glutamate-1-semialdehyde 2,1-aminomutase